MGNHEDSLKVKKSATNVVSTPVAKPKNAEANGKAAVFKGNVVAHKEQTPQSAYKPQNIDIDKMAEQYENNPIGLLKALGIKFDPKEIKEIIGYLKDKKSIKAFLAIARQSNLNPKDILAGVRKCKEFKNSSIFKRTGTFFKKLFTTGVSDAIDYAKSERVHYSKELGQNMSEIRKERKDFSSEGTASIADKETKNPKIKKNTRHFITKNATKDKKLYTEKDVTRAVDIIVKNPNDADTFTANAAELEAIQDKNGNVKYKGSTIINVDERMTDKKELRSTMMKTAKKSDMNDEYLDNITKNLYENPYMQKALDYTLDSKNSDGTDRFSAGSVNTESNQLVDKNESYCNQYTDNIKKITANTNIKDDDIISITEHITTHPDIADSVLEKIKSNNISSEEAKNYSENAAKNSHVTNSGEIDKENTISKTYDEKYKKLSYFEIKAKVKEEVKTDKNQTTKQTTNDETYNRDNVERELYKRYGTLAEKILQRLEKNSDFITLMKKYNGNKEIISALLDNPTLIDRIKQSSSSVTITEMADIIKQCTDPKSTQVMLEALSKYGTFKALRIVRLSKINNAQEDTLNILVTYNKDNKSKTQALNVLYGKSTEKNTNVKQMLSREKEEGFVC